jgi:hypothetical protein
MYGPFLHANATTRAGDPLKVVKQCAQRRNQVPRMVVHHVLERVRFETTQYQEISLQICKTKFCGRPNLVVRAACLALDDVILEHDFGFLRSDLRASPNERESMSRCSCIAVHMAVASLPAHSFLPSPSSPPPAAGRAPPPSRHVSAFAICGCRKGGEREKGKEEGRFVSCSSAMSANLFPFFSRLLSPAFSSKKTLSVMYRLACLIDR